MTSGEPVIRVRSAGKRYQITTRSERTVFKSLVRRLTQSEGSRELWALRDVSFDLHRGERLGVIGLNGAGKTTLLTILAGIIDPTEGSVEVRGVIRSPFLGLGAALQAELNVEDNIRLCGSLLGLSREELRRRLSAIIEFGELEPYRYAKLMELSSGYQARVAFATALHADSDIIMVDETLAVGDMDFAGKCRAVFEKRRKQGNTMILVSHEMGNIRRMCDRCLYLERGRLKAIGPAAEVARMFEEDHGPKR